MAGTAVTKEQLKAINQFSRRELSEEEVFVFSVILCDNEVDRDGEQFPRDSLEKLSALYLGKTGVFDHSAKAENQSARIFQTKVLREERANSLGEDYCCLKAWAYMVRCEKTKDLILEIDAGIKKEVSVGCAVKRVSCSICGADQKGEGCAHQKGKAYGGQVCHHLLEHPTDAYEWSFVAVPAQKEAGVVKGYAKGGPLVLEGEATLTKLFEAERDVVLSKAQLDSLARQYQSLKVLAGAGEEYLEGLRREVVKVTTLAQPSLDPALVEAVAANMDTVQLKAFRKSFGASAAQAVPLQLQLGRSGGKEENATGDRPFRI